MKSSDDPLKKILKVRKGTLGEFRERNSPDERIIRNRLLAVPLLRGYWAGKEKGEVDGLIMQKLNCGPQHLERASTLLQTDPEFREQLDTIMGVKKRPPKPLKRDKSPDSKPTDKDPDDDLEPRVVRLIKAAARLGGTSVEAVRSLLPNTELARVRDVILATLTKQFGYSQTDAAQILNKCRTNEDTIRAMSRMRPPDEERLALLRQVCEELMFDYPTLLSEITKPRGHRG
jgi:hypothetical protein